MPGKEDLGPPAAERPKALEEGPIGVELAGGTEPGHGGLGRDQVQADPAMPGDLVHLAQEAGVEGEHLDSLADCPRPWSAGP